jgi:predicted nucleic acid-binding protein
VSRIICNSGPLIALGILARLDILKSLFDEVLVPEAVHREIERGGVRLSGLEEFRRAEWVRIVPLKEERHELLESLLDSGEAAVISLAIEQKATLVLIDERNPA